MGQVTKEVQEATLHEGDLAKKLSDVHRETRGIPAQQSDLIDLLLSIHRKEYLPCDSLLGADSPLRTCGGACHLSGSGDITERNGKRDRDCEQGKHN